MNALASYLEQYGLVSLEKQEKLKSLLGDHTMELDFDAGLIRFSSAYEFPFQVLGTESDNTLTWLWAWAEEQTEVPEEQLRSARQMREWGAKENLIEFTTPSVDLTSADGLIISLISSEICGASCYYQDSYDGGALFLLLFGQTIDVQAPLDAAGLLRQLSGLASIYEFNHRNALRSYLRSKGLAFSEAGLLISGDLESGENIQAVFNEQDALVSLNGNQL